MAKINTKMAFTVLGVVAVAAGAYWLINRKNTLSNTGTSGSAPVPSQPVVPGGTVGSGNQAYTTQPNVILRSSASTNDPFWGIFGGNNNLTIYNAGTWIGTVIAVFPDTDGAVNPLTGKVYNWYQITLSQTQGQNFSLPAGTVEFVREDFVQIR